MPKQHEGDRREGRAETAVCEHCGRYIAEVHGAWVDAGTTDLVFCHDQDETPDNLRHWPKS